MRIKNTVMRGVLGALIFIFTSSAVMAQKSKGLTTEEIVEAMKQSSEYMVNTVSRNGGYLWYYSEDLTEFYGEVPARPSQIWVQGAGTPAMGHLFLEMYRTTGEEVFLNYAKKAADALVYGQHPTGGWHYFIDFDKPGMAQWYADTATQYLVGWEEYRHYYGNCTYDDDVTQGATRFLLHLYKETYEATYLPPLRKALDFILISQYPNGGWPQRYPLRYEHVQNDLPDYTSFYTLNDGSMNNIIDVLIEAYEVLGNEEYLEAARRGGDFFMISQGPEGHAGWAAQFDMELKPATARTHEPAAYEVRYTRSTIHQLEKLFLYTGDRRYLRPIPDALEWIESVITGIDSDGNPEFAKAYDPETNYPIIRDFIPETDAHGYLKYKYTLDTTVSFVTCPSKMDIRKRYEMVRDVEPGKERELYDEMNADYRINRLKADEKKVKKIITSMNDNGMWIETCTVHDINKTMEPNFEAVASKGYYRYAVKEIEGISTLTYLINMHTMLKYLRENK